MCLRLSTDSSDRTLCEADDTESKFSFVEMGMEPMALCTLDKLSTTELYPSPSLNFFVCNGITTHHYYRIMQRSLPTP